MVNGGHGQVSWQTCRNGNGVFQGGSSALLGLLNPRCKSVAFFLHREFSCGDLSILVKREAGSRDIGLREVTKG